LQGGPQALQVPPVFAYCSVLAPSPQFHFAHVRLVERSIVYGQANQSCSMQRDTKHRPVDSILAQHPDVALKDPLFPEILGEIPLRSLEWMRVSLRVTHPESTWPSLRQETWWGICQTLLQPQACIFSTLPNIFAKQKSRIQCWDRADQRPSGQSAQSYRARLKEIGRVYGNEHCAINREKCAKANF